MPRSVGATGPTGLSSTYVHPRWRASTGAELQTELLNTALGVIGSQGGGHVHLWVPKPGPIDGRGCRGGRDAARAPTSSRCEGVCRSPTRAP